MKIDDLNMKELDEIVRRMDLAELYCRILKDKKGILSINRISTNKFEICIGPSDPFNYRVQLEPPITSIEPNIGFC